MAEQPSMTVVESSASRDFHPLAGPRVRNAVLLLIGIGTLLRLLLAANIGLGVDESYAVTVARDWSLSYFDHPPLSFWLAGAVARIAGSEYRLLVRLPFILLFAGTSWMLYKLGARLFGERAGFYAALLLNLCPVFSISTGGWVLPDGPLLFFMLATVLCLERVLLHEGTLEHPTRWWLAPGYLLLFPLLGAAVDQRLTEGSVATHRWLVGSAAGFLILLAVAATHAATGWMARLAPTLFERGDPSWELIDWSELRPALAERGVTAGTHRIVAVTSWIDAGKVAHALGPGIPVVCLCDHPHHFRFLYPAKEALGRDVLLVERVRNHDNVAADMARYSRTVAPLGAVTIHRLGHPEFQLGLYLARDYSRLGPADSAEF
jgi:hypothetical protein